MYNIIKRQSTCMRNKLKPILIKKTHGFIDNFYIYCRYYDSHDYIIQGVVVFKPSYIKPSYNRTVIILFNVFTYYWLCFNFSS